MAGWGLQHFPVNARLFRRFILFRRPLYLQSTIEPFPKTMHPKEGGNHFDDDEKRMWPSFWLPRGKSLFNRRAVWILWERTYKIGWELCSFGEFWWQIWQWIPSKWWRNKKWNGNWQNWINNKEDNNKNEWNWTNIRRTFHVEKGGGWNNQQKNKFNFAIWQKGTKGNNQNG